MAKEQPHVAAMEGLFTYRRCADRLDGVAMKKQTIDNPLVVNDVLSFWAERPAEVQTDQVPRSVASPLPFCFIAIHQGRVRTYCRRHGACRFFAVEGQANLDSICAADAEFPASYIANTAGWMMAEIAALGRLWPRSYLGRLFEIFPPATVFLLLIHGAAAACSRCCYRFGLSNYQKGPHRTVIAPAAADDQRGAGMGFVWFGWWLPSGRIRALDGLTWASVSHPVARAQEQERHRCCDHWPGGMETKYADGERRNPVFPPFLFYACLSGFYLALMIVPGS
jgi:hypothetical protein